VRHGCCSGEAGGEARGAQDIRGVFVKDVAEDDFLDELGLDAGLFYCFLEQGDEQAFELRVSE
jgi:hypothetical protein